MALHRSLFSFGLHGQLLLGLVLVLTEPFCFVLGSDFASEVYPLLQRSCFECHSEKKQEGDLRLDQRSFIPPQFLQHSATAKSELLRRVKLPRTDSEIMPAIGEPLKPREIQILEQWISEGAPWPKDFQSAKHWAYVPPRAPPLPRVSRPEWVRTSIDAFVLKRLDDEGLSPSQEAATETLLRRLFLDTIGLPPTPSEVDRFLADTSTEAYEGFVDELLSRPQFGERWARHWLDLARYADSHGFQRDDLRDLWAYRDWVIQAMNADMPFDQFTIEQIAGDLLPNATPSQRIATGFHRCAPTNVEAGSLPEETRVEQLIDRVNTTGAVWLGTTLECAQCHDHKYDPFSMKDYYRLLAYFNHTELEADLKNPNVPSSIAFLGPSMSIPNEKHETELATMRQEIAGLKERLDARHTVLRKDLNDWTAPLREKLKTAPREYPLEILEFSSQGTTDTVERQSDGSILLVGEDPPETDLYEFKVRLKWPNITALRLETLTHEALPGKGPGRGESARPNFVLHEFTADIIRKNQQSVEPQRISFAKAVASFSQANMPVERAIDGNEKTGWAIAPEFKKSHWARFQLTHPLDASTELELRIRLDQHFGGARNIGRFRLVAIAGEVDQESIPGEIAEVLGVPSDQWNEDQISRLVTLRAESDAQCKSLTTKISRIEKRAQADVANKTLVMVERKERRPSYVFLRGDYRQQGEAVEAGTPIALHPQQDTLPNRLGLAKWLVDPQNPLVARVTVNRWWNEIFGSGLVTTVEDFGLKGEVPTHPELLDHLAWEMMANGWSMKHTLKSIFLSATYRQSSVTTPEMLERDDQNRLLSRGPRFRMDAEMIRDNALAISGLLSLKSYGPPIRPFQPAGLWIKVGGQRYDYEVSPGSEQDRRGIYVVLKRGSPYPSFINFDSSARLACTVKRSRTNTPLQALDLLNDPVFVRASQNLALRVLRERAEANTQERMIYAFRLCVSRRPTPAEQSILIDSFNGHFAAYQADTARADAALPSSDLNGKVSSSEFAAWIATASTLLNLHETINKD